MKKIIISILFLLLVVEIYAQSAVNSSGKDISGSGGTIAFTIGQVAYNSYSIPSYTLTEGVHQALEISIVLNVDTSNVFG